jgi:hypothetical protein
MFTLVGNVFGDTIVLNKALNYVSTGNFYSGHAVNAYDDNVNFYSTGDRFCYGSAFSSGCDNDSTIGFTGGHVVFQSSQPKDGNIPALPARFGSDVNIHSASTASGEAGSPILKIGIDDVSGQGKTFMEMGQGSNVYQMSRGTNGWLYFTGSQANPYRGYVFDGPVKLPTMNWSTISGLTTSITGTVVFCTDCSIGACATTGGGR